MITKIDSHTSQEVWESLYHLEKKLSGKTDNAPIFSNVDDYRLHVLGVVLGDNSADRFILNDGDIFIGVLDLKFYKYESKVEFCKVQLQYLPRELSKSLTNSVIQLLIAQMDSVNLHSVLSDSSEDKIDKFFDDIEAKKENQLNYYTLSIKGVDNSLLNDWLDNQHVKTNRYHTVFSEYVPDNIINEFTEVFTELMNDVIRDNSQERFQETPEGLRKKIESFKIRDIKLIACLLYDKSKLIGLTFVLVRGGQVSANQEMTGIRRDYRGQRLGQFLKAQILVRMRETFPQVEYLKTNCYNSNNPIIGINLRMGYILEKKISQYRVTKEVLVKMASRQQSV